MELNTVAIDRQEIFSEFRLYGYSVSLQIIQWQCDDFLRGLIEIHQFRRKFFLAEKSSQSPDHIRRAVAVPNRAARGFTRSLDVRRIALQHPQTGTRVGNDASQWLIDLLGTGCSQRT